MATYYKVVRVDRKGGYRSAVIDGKACLRYALGERTEGFEGMPVLVFRGKGAAQAFAQDESTARKTTRVLAGEAGKPRRQARVCGMWSGLLGFRAFWRGDKGLAVYAPLGTYAADWFEPEREVA